MLVFSTVGCDVGAGVNAGCTHLQQLGAPICNSCSLLYGGQYNRKALQPRSPFVAGETYLAAWPACVAGRKRLKSAQVVGG